MENSMDEKEWLEKAEKSISDQPIEGLLYDLDLMPEQCKSSHSNITRLVVTRLREETERVRKALEDILKEDLQKGEEMYQLVKRTRLIAFYALKEGTRESQAIEG